MQAQNTQSNPRLMAKPWYKELWFWLLISPMLTLIVTVPIMLTTAFKGADDRVIDDYYKEGRMINNRFEAQALALTRGISGQLDFDWTVGEVWFVANTSLSEASLNLGFSHPAKAELDFSLTLKKASAKRYRADLPSMYKGRWYIYLEGGLTDGEGEKVWRLSETVNLTDSRSIPLQARAY